MPYSLNSSPEIIKDLPIGAKKIWIKAFNAAYSANNNESYCIKIAWTAIKQAGYKKDDSGKWRRWA